MHCILPVCEEQRGIKFSRTGTHIKPIGVVTQSRRSLVGSMVVLLDVKPWFKPQVRYSNENISLATSS